MRKPQMFHGIPWTDADEEIAAGEGWGLFVVNRDPGIEIERDDEADIFEDDDEAVAWVIEQCEDGGGTHHKALLICALADGNSDTRSERA